MPGLICDRSGRSRERAGLESEFEEVLSAVCKCYIRWSCQKAISPLQSADLEDSYKQDIPILAFDMGGSERSRRKGRAQGPVE